MLTTILREVNSIKVLTRNPNLFNLKIEQYKSHKTPNYAKFQIFKIFETKTPTFVMCAKKAEDMSF